MKINAAIAAAIMAATVSAAALPQTTEATAATTTEAAAAPTEVAAPADIHEAMTLVEVLNDYPEDVEFKEFKKRAAEAGFHWTQWRPFGLPYGKSISRNPNTYLRPTLTILGDASAEAEAKFRWTQWRPFGLPYGRRTSTPTSACETYTDHSR
jgi:mating pheromone alpha-factor